MIPGYLVNLRALEAEDMPLLVEWRNNPEVYEYYYYGCEPISLISQQHWFENWLSRSDERLFMITSKEKEPVGTVGLVKIDMRSRKAETGRLFLGRVEWRGLGYGAEAQFLLFKYAFEHLNLHKLYTEVFTFNTSVISMNEKLGMKRVGVFKEHIYRNGVYEDVLIMELFRKDFDAKRQKLEKLFAYQYQASGD